MELNKQKNFLVVLIIIFFKAGILFENTPKRYYNSARVTPKRKTWGKSQFLKKKF
jgi:hypothetical protein